MTPDQYPVPAEQVVAILKNHLFCRGESREHHAPMTRAQLMHALGIPPARTAAFARQLKDMQSRKNFKAHRVCFQYFPTGWIYNPLPPPPEVITESSILASIEKRLNGKGSCCPAADGMRLDATTLLAIVHAKNDQIAALAASNVPT